MLRATSAEWPSCYHRSEKHTLVSKISILHGLPFSRPLYKIHVHAVRACKDKPLFLLANKIFPTAVSVVLGGSSH